MSTIMRRFRTTGTFLFAALTALSTSACSFLTGVRNVDRVTVTVAPTTISINQTAAAFGASYDGNDALQGNRYAVTFSSSNQAIATVNPTTGIVVGVSYGSTYIVGQNNGKRDSAMITVRPVQALQLIFSNKNPVYRVGAQNVIAATGYDSLGRVIGDRAVTWVARTPTVLTITSIGVVAPLTVGSSWIVATLDNGPSNKPAVDSVLATVTLVPVGTLVITPNSTTTPPNPTVYTGQTLQFTAVITDSLRNPVTRTVTWSTSDNGQALFIDQNGLARGVAQFISGTTSVIATVPLVPGDPANSTARASVAVAVLNPVDSTHIYNFNVSVAEISTLSVATGTTTALTLTATDVQKSTLPGRSFSVTSSNPAVASVPPTSSGSLPVTAGAAGTATITVQALDASNNPQGKASILTVTVR